VPGSVRIDAGHVRLLTAEGVRDAARRRVVPAVLVFCFLSLAMVNSCTSCNADVQISGNDSSAALDILGWAGVGVFSVLALWAITLAGLLAADHLAASLEDGSALLVLARPVSRASFALSRLIGSLAVSIGAGLVLMGGATFFLAARSDLAIAPALLATLAAVLSSVCIAALAMAASLYLPRVAVFIMVLGGVALISIVNWMSFTGAEQSMFFTLLNGFGPPLASSLAHVLAPWSDQAPAAGALLSVSVRLVVWAVGSIALLLFVFERRELTSFDA
jgi:ABC-type transport system involved in multi-copper enzyme maturation permease subunit